MTSQELTKTCSIVKIKGCQGIFVAKCIYLDNDFELHSHWVVFLCKINYLNDENIVQSNLHKPMYVLFLIVQACKKLNTMLANYRRIGTLSRPLVSFISTDFQLSIDRKVFSHYLSILWWLDNWAPTSYKGQTTHFH